MKVQEGCATQHIDTPLFDERARKDHPDTSHRRAEELTRTPKLTMMVVAVLRIVAEYQGRTAHELGRIMYRRSGNIEQTTWPHKNMIKLERAGWVYRMDENKTGLLCYITEEGKSQLNEAER